MPIDPICDDRRIVFETDEVLIPVSINQLYQAVLLDNNRLLLIGRSETHTLNHFLDQNIQQLLDAGFIQIHSNYLIHPGYIHEYKITEHEIELFNGNKLSVSPDYQQKLMDYFKNMKC